MVFNLNFGTEFSLVFQMPYFHNSNLKLVDFFF